MVEAIKTFRPNRYIYVIIGNMLYDKNPADYCKKNLPLVAHHRLVVINAWSKQVGFADADTVRIELRDATKKDLNKLKLKI